MNFNIDLKNLKDNISFSAIAAAIGCFWLKIYRFVLLFLFIVLVVWGGFFWYTSAQDTELSSEKKEELIQEQVKSKEFKKEQFDAVIKTLKEREGRFEEEIPPSDDIFHQNFR